MGRSSMPTVFLLPALLLAALAASDKSLTVKPGCQESCGGVDIPYPYGIGKDCFRPGFEITCVNNTTPVLGNSTIRSIRSIPVLNISVMPRPEAWVMLPVSYQCFESSTGYANAKKFNGGLTLGHPRRISNTGNELYVLGCNTSAYTRGNSVSSSDDYMTGCMAYCKDIRSAQDGACAGVGCCHVEIPPGITGNGGMTFINKSHLRVIKFNPCDSAFIVAKGNYTFRTADLKNDPSRISRRPVVLDWAIRDNNNYCAQARNRPDYACVSSHSECVDSTNDPGYFCTCTGGYEGNPYLQNGCTNINECARPREEFPCHGECQDTEGSYNCPCYPGYVLSGNSTDAKVYECDPKFPLPARLALGISVGVSSLVVAILLAFIMLQKRKLDKLFEKNGGKILQNVLGLSIFTKEELKKVTNNNSEFLGNGRFGKVYKGTLPDDTMVAVKASIKVNKDTKQEFAEEVEIQTHMIHKNILKLIGCCLEVDVPMLVYEFAANGSLQETLHGNKREKLPLDLRLDIAIGSAEGLRYMHSEAIRHGDVKPDNILLDDKLTPKVSDFGLSKLLKEEYVANTVVGCMGYIDPMFMKTGLLTQKSDVYSFGVVLLELITGKKNIYDENHSLIIEFCKVYDKEKSGRAMFDKWIIVTEEDIFILEKIGMLAIECLKEDIEDRPDMTEVAERLVMVRRDRKTGKTQNRGPRRFEDITMEESLNNTDINK